MQRSFLSFLIEWLRGQYSHLWVQPLSFLPRIKTPALLYQQQTWIPTSRPSTGTILAQLLSLDNLLATATFFSFLSLWYRPVFSWPPNRNLTCQCHKAFARKRKRKSLSILSQLSLPSPLLQLIRIKERQNKTKNLYKTDTATKHSLCHHCSSSPTSASSNPASCSYSLEGRDESLLSMQEVRCSCYLWPVPELAVTATWQVRLKSDLFLPSLHPNSHHMVIPL